ncbi:MAG TPA: D-2-hydroxyacid dehydrogenase family protein [Beijerinckiaceae bacterium]|nr:D-2-hydroxyacid dehydrogenase family protein [Beijerinckiaceae bacterium]
MTRIAILDDYQRVAMTMADWSALPPECDLVVFDRNLETEDEAARALADFDVVCLLRERMPMPRTLIERLPALRLIVVTGAHNRTLDLAAAKERGITVSHTRGGDSQYATPELAWGLILSLMRHIPQEHQRMREGGWQETVGTALHGQTLSILGLGRLGSRMASIGRAFGMEVLAWSPNLTAERAEAAGATLVAKNELFARADVLTIHLVLGERSRGLVGAAELQRMKPSAVLINTSRGPIVDEAALIAALEARDIRGAGLDVYDREPLPADHPLRRLDNVVLTPHLGYVTEGTYRMFYADTVEAIAAWRAGTPVRTL